MRALVALLIGVLAAACLFTPLGMIWVFAGDSYLLTSGHYAFLTLLWASHLVFWIAYIGVTSPVFSWFLSRRRGESGEEALAAVVTGLAGFGYLLWASVKFLHRDQGFFTPRNLALNGTIFLAILAVAGGLYIFLRRCGPLVRRASTGAAVTGLLLTLGIWGATFAMTPSFKEEVNLEMSEEGIPVDVSSRPGKARRVTLLGLDGADWRFIDALIAKGELPSFTKLRNEGTTTAMTTISPFSPVVWTSIATGMDPGRHGVQYFSEMYFAPLDLPIHRLHHNFLEPLYSRYFDKIPVTSRTRTAKAIWEIGGAFGMQSLVLNWWATFPTGPGEGHLVSNYAIPWDEISADRLKSWDGVNKVYPDEIWPTVRETMQKAVKGGIRTTSWTGDDPEAKLTHVDFWDLRDAIVLELYGKLRRPEHALSAVYLQGIDTTCHHYSETVFGKNADIPRESRVDEGVSSREQEMVDQVYRKMDDVLGGILAGMEEGDLVMVVSDHGWRFDGTSHWRMPDAILAMYGSGVRRGFSPARAHVYDVAPTLMYYLGLPLSRELPGRVIEEAFVPETLRYLSKFHVATYGRRTQPMRIADPATDEAYIERLKSLGYIQ